MQGSRAGWIYCPPRSLWCPGWRAPVSLLITCPAIRTDSQAGAGRLQLLTIYLLLLSQRTGRNLKVQVSAPLPDASPLKHFHIAPVSCRWGLPLLPHLLPEWGAEKAGVPAHQAGRPKGEAVILQTHAATAWESNAENLQAMSRREGPHQEEARSPPPLTQMENPSSLLRAQLSLIPVPNGVITT